MPQAAQTRPFSQAASSQAAPSSSSDFGEIVNESSRQRSSARLRRRTNSWAGPAIVIVLLLAALVGVALVLKNHSADELLAKLEQSPGKQKSKADGEPRHESSTKHHAAAAKDQESEPSDNKPSENGPATYSPPPGALSGLLKRLAASVAAGHIEATDTVGGPGGMIFRDLPSTGALLVGFDFGLSPLENSDTQAISSVCGIFLVSERVTEMGTKQLSRHLETHGGDQRSITHIRAKPGYAVGGLDLVPGDRVTGVRVHFYAITKNGLSSDKSYYSDWVGPAGDQPAVKLGDGRPVVGIAGTSSTLVNRLGLILDTSASEIPTVEKPLAEKSNREPRTKTPLTPEAMSPAGATPPSMDWSRRVFANLPGGNNDQPPIPVPAAEDLRKAKGTVRDLFKDQYAEIGANASKPLIVVEKKYALAKKLYQEAEKENDPAARYALLDEARRLTSEIGYSEGVLMTINFMGSRFQIDDVQLTIDSLTDASNVTTASAAYKRQLAENSLMLIAKAVEHERFDAAERLASLAQKVAASTRMVS